MQIQYNVAMNIFRAITRDQDFIKEVIAVKFPP